MKEQGREKPVKVEPGQRWRCMDAVNWLVTAVDDDKITVVAEDGAFRGSPSRAHVSSLLSQSHWAYLGGPSPSPEGAGRVMEARTDDGTPVSCLGCGGYRALPAFFCAVCCKRISADARGELCNFWKRGARDFPRSPAPVPVVPKPVKAVEQCMAYCPANGYLCVEKQGHGGLHRSFVGPWKETLRAPEMQREGVALSALQAIQSRPKPEPWVESCDPLHWLRDA